MISITSIKRSFTKHTSVFIRNTMLFSNVMSMHNLSSRWEQVLLQLSSQVPFKGEEGLM